MSIRTPTTRPSWLSPGAPHEPRRPPGCRDLHQRNRSDIDSLKRASRYRRLPGRRRSATALFLSLRLPQPLLLEGEAGVGKTEAAKALAAALDTELIRLQCYEGIDSVGGPLRVELPAPTPQDPLLGGAPGPPGLRRRSCCWRVGIPRPLLRRLSMRAHCPPSSLWMSWDWLTTTSRPFPSRCSPNPVSRSPRSARWTRPIRLP